MNMPQPRERCGAKTRSGEPCKRYCTPGRNRCKFHGGRTLTGIASPSFVTGRYSKYLPSRLMERYQEAAGDKELLNLQHDIALVDARLADVLGRVDTGESGVLWREMKTAKTDLLKAKLSKDTLKQQAALATLLSLIDSGLEDYAAWGEIQGLLEQRRKLVESERKRLVEMQQLITSEQAMTLVTALLDSVRRNVPDRNALSAIQTEFVSLVNRGNQQQIKP